MRTVTANYDVERRKLATRPRYILRFAHVPQQGLFASYPFSVDFCSGPIAGSTKTKLPFIEQVMGVSSSISPEQGRASISGYSFVMTDVDGQVLKYFAQPELRIGTGGISASDTTITLVGANAQITVAALPDPTATIEITADNVADAGVERIRYTGKDDVSGTLTGVTRGVDGTTARAWLAGDHVTNGEQIRPGQRVTVLCGYANMVEADFMDLPTMSVYQRSLSNLEAAAYVVEVGDIMRSLRAEIFMNASRESPVILEGHPYTIALWILTSTGTGTNGDFDVLAAENGLGIPQEFIDIDGILLARNDFVQDTYCFEIWEPAIGKEWLEKEIFKPTNTYPVIIQGGKLSFKAYLAPL